MAKFLQGTFTDPQPRRELGKDDQPDDDINAFNPRRALREGGGNDKEDDENVEGEQGEPIAVRLTATTEVEPPYFFSKRNALPIRRLLVRLGRLFPRRHERNLWACASGARTVTGAGPMTAAL